MTVPTCRKCRKKHERAGRLTCTGHRSSDPKTPCYAWPAAGAPVCGMHGGRAPQVKAKAAERRAEDEQRKAVQQLALPRDVPPAVALREEVHRTAGAIAWLDQQVAHLDKVFVETMFGPKPHALVDLWVEERKRLVLAATADLKAGVEERITTLQEDTAALVAQVLRAVVDDLKMSAAERARVPELLGRHLRAITA